MRYLPNGIWEEFEIWVLYTQAAEVKAQYEARGYKVV